VSLPNNALSNPAQLSSLLSPDNQGRIDPLVDYERGGVDLNDSSQGLNVRDWRVRVFGKEVRVSYSPFQIETVLFSGPSITEISLSFDQNMRPTVAYIQAGEAKLYWFDSFAAAQVITNLPANVVSVFVTMDDKRAIATDSNINDILLFYIRDSFLYYVQQRERFAVERVLAALSGSGTIIKAGMAANNRVQIEVDLS
jgi:hypothetical protein